MKVICVGDSITRGQVSGNYVKLLESRLTGSTVLNAGVNYDVSAHMLDRLSEVVDQDPDVVTVLIGTNDATATLGEQTAQKLRNRWKLTEDPSPDRYAANLAAIATRLKDETRARIALISPPVLGEDLDSVALRRTSEFGEIVRKVAAEQFVTYLPLNEQMVEYLEKTDHTPRVHYRADSLLAPTAAMQHFFLGRGFDAISKSRGLLLTTDTVHLNSRGAGMIADLIEGFVRSS
ncbi:MAG TPA: GDSL-type esterase/lipase family protein [Nonomuraea sp.]|nr:GDSL-type esterase/lipase family protein [Nonomuraea sp.]